MSPAKSRISDTLYWQIVDHFERNPGDWRLLGKHWEVENVVATRRRLSLHAIITAGLSFKTASSRWPRGFK